MRQLVIDTATEALSVALFEDGQLIANHHEITGRGHAEKLLPVIIALENETREQNWRADEIIVNNGPGSFTGVRVGLAAARALSYAWGVSLRAYGSLSMIAAIAKTMDADIVGETAGEAPSPDIIITMNGGHGEIFWQIFDRATLQPKTQPASTPIPLLAQEMSANHHGRTYYGTAAQALVDALGVNTSGHGAAVPLYPDARYFPHIPAHLIHADAVPLYGRGADAIPLDQRPAKKKEK